MNLGSALSQIPPNSAALCKTFSRLWEIPAVDNLGYYIPQNFRPSLVEFNNPSVEALPVLKAKS